MPWPWPVTFPEGEILLSDCSACGRERVLIHVADEAESRDPWLCYPCLRRDGGIGGRRKVS